MSKKWLNEAVFYEIYPQSFCDSNADGIGDIPGIINKLDYIQELGCDAIWMNPCFDSPFMDAGYDVRDFCRVAPRYGTNEDLKQLFEGVHARGMHIILDLVAGHTSNECEWFKESCKQERNRYSDRYIWTNTVWDAPNNVGSIMGWLRGVSERDGAAALNFFTGQPALNYGFYQKDEKYPWQKDTSENGPQDTMHALIDVMRFWLGMGCDGFRVDMAGSLVKNDPESKGTIALWNTIFKEVKHSYPDSVFVSEWGEADKALAAGFDMDFVLHFGPSHYLDLFREKPFFAKEGEGSAAEFLRIYLENLKKTEGKGLICIPSGNHDMVRLAKTLPTAAEEKIAFAFLMSMPGVPFVYYGDEVGMRYVEGLPSKEGGYFRTGSRTPMQWDTTTNAGFSAAGKEDLYLPQDTEGMDERNAAVMMEDENSLWHEISDLIAIRKAHQALLASSELKVLKDDGYPLIYQRRNADETILVLLNPSEKDLTLDMDVDGEVLYCFDGKEIENGVLPAQSAIFVKL